MSVCLKFKISITAKPIEPYSLKNIPTGPTVVFSPFRVDGKIPYPPKKIILRPFVIVKNLQFLFF